MRYGPQQWPQIIIRHGSRRSKQPPFRPPPITNYRCTVPNCANDAKGWHYITHRKRKIWEAKRQDLTNPKKPPPTKFINKVIPLCQPHMTLVEDNNYFGPSLKKQKGITPNEGPDGKDLLRHVKKLKKFAFPDDGGSPATD